MNRAKRWGAKKGFHELGERARDLLYGTVLRDWHGLPEAVEVRARRVRSFKAGKWRVFYYGLEAGEEKVAFTLTYGDRKGLGHIYQRHYGTEATSRAALFLEDESFLIERFPNDWKLPALGNAVDTAAFAALLVETGVFKAENAGDLDVSITMPRYFPHKRCLLHYKVSGAGREESYFGKVYSSWARARRSYQALSLLRQDPDTAGIGPEPLIYREDWDFVLMATIPGRRLITYLDEEKDEGGRRAAIAAVARMLAGLHRIDFPGGGVADVEDDLVELRRLEKQIPRTAAAAGERIAVALDRLLRAAEPFLNEPRPHAFTHGDFNPRQILMDGGIARVVDFDSAGPGDPAMDVGRFMASLLAQAVELGDVGCRDLAEHFLAEYVAASGNDLSARARYFEVLGLLYRAARILVSTTYRNVDEPFEVINEAEACLARMAET